MCGRVVWEEGGEEGGEREMMSDRNNVSKETFDSHLQLVSCTCIMNHDS
jgi:hypothetical protein